MSDDFEFNVRELREKKGGRGSAEDGAGSRGRGYQRSRRREARSDSEASYDAERLIEERSSQSPAGEGMGPPRGRFDPWRLVEALQRRLGLLAGLIFLCGGVGFGAAYWQAPYKVKLDLIKNELPTGLGSAQGAEEHPKDITFETTASYVKDPELLKNVSLRALGERIFVTPEGLEKSANLLPDRNPDVVTLELTRRGPKAASVRLANLYAAELVDYLKQKQTNESAVIDNFLAAKLAANQRELEKHEADLKEFSKRNSLVDVEKEAQSYLTRLEALDTQYSNAQLDSEELELRMRLAQANPGSDKLRKAQEELEQLQKTKTDLHQDVIAKMREIKELERQAKVVSTNSGQPGPVGLPYSLGSEISALANKRMILTNQLAQLKKKRESLETSLSSMSEKAVEYALLKGMLKDDEQFHQVLVAKKRDAQLIRDNARGYYRVFAPATLHSIDAKMRWLMIGFLTGAGGFLGLLMGTGGVLLKELTDNRIKTAFDVQKATRLPVLASLGDLNAMSPEEQVNWAFRTLTVLKGKLHAANGHSLVCGFISAHHGEGRSTWIKLLVSAANQRGLRVLTVATRPAGQGSDEQRKENDSAGTDVEASNALTTLSRNMLASRREVEDQLNDPEAQPVIHIPLPGWVWNLERRKQWHAALNQWRKIENLVLLVELPPASQAEAILLAENVPQLIWLSGSGMADSAETETYLETLRQAGCNLVGAVLNREPASVWKDRLSRWVSSGAAALVLLGAPGVLGAELRTFPVVTNTVQRGPEGMRASESEASTNLSFSAGVENRRAPWQERLTVGPGDVLNFLLYGFPELSRTNLVVGPDGRISYLQAQNVEVTGLTIEEVRARFDDVLSKFYPAAKTVVLPVAFNSKKYYMLGKVNSPGAYRLDRPVTLIEAVARARGLETGLFDRAPVELADLTRSFLVRHGRRMSVNFEKLFLEGDLSQNIPLEPDDYLYFAPASLSQVYVLGRVVQPGVVGYRPGTTLISAITASGGFLPKAYKSKVLVVRGSLQYPEPLIVDTVAILDARQPDFKLEPRDIVYVSARPWAKIEELLDEAGQAFVESVATTWTGFNIGPIITKPIVPHL